MIMNQFMSKLSCLIFLHYILISFENFSYVANWKAGLPLAFLSYQQLKSWCIPIINHFPCIHCVNKQACNFTGMPVFFFSAAIHLM